MSVNCSLINESKKEWISFHKLPASTRGEIIRNGVSSRIVTLYLMENQGDRIRFISDEIYDSECWPLDVSREELFDFKEVTLAWLDKAEGEGFISGRWKDTLSEWEQDLYYWRFNEE